VQGLDWRPDCFRDQVLAARSNVPSSMPFLLTEYSVMVGEGSSARPGEPPFQHDRTGAAAFVLRVVLQLTPHLDVLSYWTFSDVFEENGLPKSEYHNHSRFTQPHYGAMTLHGVPNPVWRAFQLLHTHAGSHQFDGAALKVTNFATSFNGSGAPIPLLSAAATSNLSRAQQVDATSVRLWLSHWDASGNESITRTHAPVLAHITLQLAAGVRLVKSTFWMIDASSQAHDLWEEMGSPDVPTPDQITQLMARSELKPRVMTWRQGPDNVATARIILHANTAVVVSLAHSNRTSSEVSDGVYI